MSDKILRVDHIGIAVADLEKAIETYRAIFGDGPTSIEDVADQKVRTAFFAAGDSRIELLHPTEDDSPIAKFLARRGEGIHHICFAVPDVQSALDTLSQRGFKLIDSAPRSGAHGKRIAFVHPKSTGGVLIELSETPQSPACPPRRAPHEGPPTR